MTSTTKVNYATLTDEDDARFGLDAGEALFHANVAAGLTNGDSLAIHVGFIDEAERWIRTGGLLIGPNGDQFMHVIDQQTGKLSTALTYRMDSDAALQIHGNDIPEGAPRYTGAAYHPVRVNTVANGWMERTFAGAGSGVQGHLDLSTVYAALTTAGACWALRMQALHGKP